jgi:hypothetical protein
MIMQISADLLRNMKSKMQFSRWRKTKLHDVKVYKKKENRYEIS